MKNKNTSYFKRVMNGKKGASLEYWIQGISFVVLSIILIVSIFTFMNSTYSKSYQLAGLNTSSIERNFYNLTQDADSKLGGGDVSQESSSQSGLTLSTSWEIITLVKNVVFEFIGGGFIETILGDYLMLNKTVVLFIRGLWLISIVFLIISIIFSRSRT